MKFIDSLPTLKDTRPTMYANDISALTPEALVRLDIVPEDSGIADYLFLYDVDGLGMRHHGNRFTRDAVATMLMLAETGASQQLVTNATSERRDQLWNIVEEQELPITGIWIPSDINEEHPHRARKPHPDMLEAAANKMGVEIRKTIMSGDQIKDVLAANAAGAMSFLVPRVSYDDDPRVKYAQRPAEVALRAVNKYGRVVPILTERQPDEDGLGLRQRFVRRAGRIYAVREELGRAMPVQWANFPDELTLAA